MELTEVAGQVIKAMRVYDNPPYGREVHIVFADGTELSVDIGLEIRVDAKHYAHAGGTMNLLHRRIDPPESEEHPLDG